MIEPVVTIGIATRNRCVLLRKAVASAVAQRYAACEIVVWDDASTDGTSDVAKEFPLVRWMKNAEPEGYMAIRDRMMRESRGTYFCSLDDDAWFLGDDEIGAAVDVMDSDPGVAAVAFDILDPKRSAAVAREAARPVDTFIGCGHLLRLDAVRAVGGYAALPGLYGGEEKDLCLRLFDRGWEVVLLPGVHVWHERTPAERDAFAQHASGVCNDLAIAGMRFPLRALWWRIPAKIVSHVRFALLNRLMVACVVGISRFIRMLPTVVSQRRPISAAALRKSLDPIRRGAAAMGSARKSADSDLGYSGGCE